MTDARQLLNLPPPAAGVELGKLRQGEEFRWYRLKEPAWLTPRPGSTMAVEDDLLEEYAGSHVATQALAVGNDHLRNLLGYTRDPAERPPPFASFTLARAAIEAGAVASWVVGPGTRRGRLINALRWHAQDDADLVRFVHRLTGKPERDLKAAVRAHNATALERARQLGIPATEVPLHLSSTELVRAPHLPRMSPSPESAWSAASGFAHGRRWPLMFHQLDAAPGRGRLRVTAGPGPVLWLANTAAALLDHGELVMRSRCRDPQPGWGVTRVARHP